MLTEYAPAKVNLYLHLTARRADGYHLLDSLAVFAAVGDQVSAEPADSLSLSLEGPFAAALSAEPDNLVLRAARALAEHAGVAPRAHLTLRKVLPVASGIGGGSADAAAAMRLCARLWGLSLTPDQMADIAVRLGADVPVCLGRQAVRMTGVGEILSPAPTMPACGILLVNPGVGVATQDVFRTRRGLFSGPAILPESWPDIAAMARDLTPLGNDLTAAAIALSPVINEVLAAINGLADCRLGRMSGSGATCWGLFDTADQAARVAECVRRDGWWTWGGALFAA